ncbi:GntR family transcriptional regulator [Halarcobacter mediterraneus]|uniref:GntR family transcriptional regulator n=1 Tax=Halarcobacter mediterraneus TaxID=2023153 RepID=A0A4Q1AZ31_9BACT|nr:GntR family transcriptional regulator [Halarcobacter mediterraneus]RXK14643.1 GntR family transcriptional regulator [Halarcobacter mediterraneus]
MEFNESKAIYLQIVDIVFKQILLKNIKEESRLPSIRELAVEMEVNPNTVVRSYTYMEQKNIIYKKRGVGYFVKENARKEILKDKKEIFIKETLPYIFEQMQELDLSIEDLIQFYETSK